jgi:hypothetical protein
MARARLLSPLPGCIVCARQSVRSNVLTRWLASSDPPDFKTAHAALAPGLPISARRPAAPPSAPQPSAFGATVKRQSNNPSVPGGIFAPGPTEGFRPSASLFVRQGY